MMRLQSVNRLARHLTVLAVVVGSLATLSYGSGAHVAVRFLDPPLGAWWQNSEFWIMEGAASALGMLIGVRIGARLADDLDDARARGRRVGAAMIVGAVGLAWIAPACAALARLGWSGDGESLLSRIVGLVGYDAGLFLDKDLIADVYALKTAGFALLLGLALFGLTTAVFFATVRAGESERAPVAGS